MPTISHASEELEVIYFAWLDSNLLFFLWVDIQQNKLILVFVLPNAQRTQESYQTNLQ